MEMCFRQIYVACTFKVEVCPAASMGVMAYFQGSRGHKDSVNVCTRQLLVHDLRSIELEPLFNYLLRPPQGQRLELCAATVGGR